MQPEYIPSPEEIAEQTKHERPVVVDDLSRRGDPVPFEFEPLPLG